MSWLDDGSGNLTAEGSKLTFTSAGKGDSKSSAVWTGDADTGCWEFRLQDGAGVWLGVSNKDKLAPGYGTKGLFYGGPGNLSDGGSLLRSAWGPKVDGGDTVGLCVTKSDGVTNVAFSHNGKSLGTAFSLNDWNGDLCPAVSMTKHGQSVTLTKLDTTPPGMMAGPAREGLEGSWSGKFDVTVSRAPGGWQLAAKVANRFTASIKENSDSSLAVNNVASTKMMAPAELQDLETEVVKFLEGVTGWRREEDRLVIQSSAGTQHFNQAAASPVTKNEVRWMN